jgi:hypothetical protein
VSPFELERFVDVRLRSLPAPSAPPTLLPRAIAAASAWSQRPWYAREWFAWPAGWQIASMALAMLVVVAGLLLVPAAVSALDVITARIVAPVAVPIPKLAGWVAVSVTVLRVVWQALVEPFLPYAFVIVVVMCVASATTVFALNRMVFGRAMNS